MTSKRPIFFKRFLAFVFLSSIILLVGALIWRKVKFSSGRTTTRPNILLISLCSVRADHMSCYGYHRNTTPNFDKLAAKGLVFDNAITPWPKTVPAFAAMMTGKYCHTIGVMRVTPKQYLHEKHNTLAKILSAHGYDTGAFISTPALSKQTNLLQGCATIEEIWRVPYHLRLEATTWFPVEWIKKPRRSPFFAWVHYNNAHLPYQAPGAPPSLFVDDKFYDPTKQIKVNRLPLSLDVPQNHPFARQILRPDVGGVHPRALLKAKPTELSFYIARYDAGIYGADQMAGKLLSRLEEGGFLENTIVVVVGDHGESLGNHNYYFEHGRFPYNDCARVPLIICPPEQTKSIRVHKPVAMFGLAPTLLEMVGIEPPQDMEATSLLSVAHGKGGQRYVFAESGYQLDFALSVREDEWKLIHIPNPIDRSLLQGSEYELYNLHDDPGELNNLYGSRPQIASKLRKVLNDWSQPWVKAAYSTTSTSDVKMDETTLGQLRSFGYVK
ncbi:MAG: sulfatase family protein [Planctomycetota bacterium]|jgi:arylsulfatase A-like enzyme